MDYILAKELKDAGFAQDTELGFGQRSPTGKGDWLYVPTGKPSSDMVYFPTLEELIEACGTAFALLNYSSGVKSMRTEETLTWVAGGYKAGLLVDYSGSTPTEAVARLWLALNKK